MAVQPGDPPVAARRRRAATRPTATRSPRSVSVRTRARISTRPATSFPDGRPSTNSRWNGWSGRACWSTAAGGGRRSAIRAPLLAETAGAHTIRCRRAASCSCERGGGCSTVEAAQLLVDLARAWSAPTRRVSTPNPIRCTRCCSANGILLLENLRGLEQDRAGPAHVRLPAAAVPGSDAAPARVVVWR